MFFCFYFYFYFSYKAHTLLLLPHGVMPLTMLPFLLLLFRKNSVLNLIIIGNKSFKQTNGKLERNKTLILSHFFAARQLTATSVVC